MSRGMVLILLLTLVPGAARAQEPATSATAVPPPADAPKAAQKPADAAAKKGEGTRLQVYDEIQVIDRASDMVGVADSASEGVTGRKELEQRPILRPGELLETVP